MRWPTRWCQSARFRREHRRARPVDWAPARPTMPGVTSAGPSTVPKTIHADREARTLAIEWADGHRTTYELTALRWLCPCAFCRGEAGMPGWLDSRPTLSPEQTRLVDMQLVGQYALAPEWGDGHHTGYYTFALLRDRCTCDECRARRVRTADTNETGAGHHVQHASAPGEPSLPTTSAHTSKESHS